MGGIAADGKSRDPCTPDQILHDRPHLVSIHWLEFRAVNFKLTANDRHRRMPESFGVLPAAGRHHEQPDRLTLVFDNGVGGNRG